MRGETRRFSWPGLALAALVAVVVAACGQGSSGTSSTSGSNGTLVVDQSVAPATLDPAEECGFTDLIIGDSVYSRLTQYGSKPGPNGTTQFDPSHIVPSAAQSYSTSADGTVYTFHLRPGLTFSNGDPLDAHAVQYSLQRAITMNGCGTYFIYDGFYTPALVSSITTPDSQTVVITLAHADPNYLQDLAQTAASIVDPKDVEANGGVQANNISQWMAGHVTASSGSFVLQSYQSNKQAVLVANPHAFQKPASSKIIVNFVNSDPTLLLQARNGAADVTIGLTKQSAHSLVSSSGVKVVSDPTSESEQIILNNQQAPFDNAKLRDALTYAVQYQQILSKIAFGYGELYYGPFPPVMPGYNASLEKPRTYDLAKARELIKESGVQTPLTVPFVIQEGNVIDQQIATAVQAVWSQLGVNLTIQQLSPSDYINAAEDHKTTAFLRLDGPGVIDPGYFLGYDMLCGVGFNLAGMCVPQADALLNQARLTQDATQRQQLWNQLIPLWTADSPKIPVYEDAAVTVLSKNVGSFYYSEETDMRTWAK